MIAQLLLGNQQQGDYELDKGLLKDHNRFFVGFTKEVRKKIMTALHFTATEGILVRQHVLEGFSHCSSGQK